MGSNSSKDKDTSQYGQIYLKTDKTAYSLGETVTGTIFLNMISHYPGHQLFLKFKGNEAVHVMRRVQYNSYNSQLVVGSDRKEIIKQETLVYSWDEMLAPSQFTIPFSFLLPDNLPSSFYEQGKGYFAFVEYHLEAFLKPDQDKIPKMKFKQPINIKEKIFKAKSEDLSATFKTALKTCFCCEEGSTLLKVNFEKNYYSPGETAKVSIEFDSSGASLQNQKVILSLRQKLELRSHGVSIPFDILKVQKELPRAPESFSKIAGSVNLILPQLPTETDFDRTIDKKKPDIYSLTKIKDNPNIITSTTNSRLITSTFYLEVSCPMDGCCATVPLAKCPIGILHPDPQLPVIATPSDWQPVALDSITLTFPPPSKNLLGPKKEQNDHMIVNNMPIIITGSRV